MTTTTKETTMTYPDGSRVLYQGTDPATVIKTFRSGTVLIERDARSDKSIAWRLLYVPKPDDDLRPAMGDTLDREQGKAIATFIYDEIDEAIGQEFLADLDGARTDSSLEEVVEGILEFLDGEGYDDHEISDMIVKGARS